MPRLLVTDVKARCSYSRWSLSLPLCHPPGLLGAGAAFCAPCRSTGSCSTEVPWSSRSTAPFAWSHSHSPVLGHRLYSDAPLSSTLAYSLGTKLTSWLTFPGGSETSVGFSRSHLLEGPPLFLSSANLFEVWANRHLGACAYYKVTTWLSSTVCFSTGGGGIWFSKCGPVTSVPPGNM